MTVKLKAKQSPQRSGSVPHNRKLSEETKRRPEWDGTIHDLTQHKLTPNESRKKSIITNAYTPTSIPAPTSRDELGWPVAAPTIPTSSAPTRNHTRTLSQDSDLLPVSDRPRSAGHRAMARTPVRHPTNTISSDSFRTLRSALQFARSTVPSSDAKTRFDHAFTNANLHDCDPIVDSVASDELADSAALTILNLSFRIQDIQHQLIVESDMRRRLDFQVQQHADQMKKMSQALDLILAGQSIVDEQYKTAP